MAKKFSILKFIGDVRVIGLGCSLLIAAALTIQGYAELPKRVAGIEEKIEEVNDKTEGNKDSVQELAHNIDKYIAKQEVRQEAQIEYNSLLKDYIKEIKNGS